MSSVEVTGKIQNNKPNTNRTRTEVMILRYKTGKKPSGHHRVIFPRWPGRALTQYRSQIWLGSKRCGHQSWGFRIWDHWAFVA